MSATPTRVDADLYEAARASGKVHDRSAAQQVNYWARLGRAIEQAGGLRTVEIERVLMHDSNIDYDDLPGIEKMLVRLARDRQLDDAADGIDLTGEFQAAGRSWSELDAEGNVVIRGRPAGHGE